MKRKPALPVLDWMHKRDLATVVAIEEGNHAYEGWGEDTFSKRLRQKNMVGLVVKIADVVVGFSVHEWQEKNLFLHKFELAKELEPSTAGHVLLNKLKEKACKRGRNVVAVFPEERQSIPKYKFFAKEGFKSRLKRRFFSSLECDGYEFEWKYDEDKDYKFDCEDNTT